MTYFSRNAVILVVCPTAEVADEGKKCLLAFDPKWAVQWLHVTHVGR